MCAPVKVFSNSQFLVHVKMRTVVYLCLIGFATATNEFYWREYTGTIPADAFPGGRDLDGFDTYIGQAYIHQHGVYVVQIYPGQQEVDVPCYGAKKAKTDIKILCTEKPRNFEWVSTDNKHYHLNMTERNGIQGGYDFVGNKGTLHVGRLNYQGVTKIGEIASYSLEDAKLFFPHGGKELSATFYQALVYNSDK